MHVEVKTSHERKDGPVRNSFGLSYASYYTVPRLVLESMPVWWQKIFVHLVKMLPDTPEYTVQRRDPKTKRFIKDPWANYRRGRIEEVLQWESEQSKKQDDEDNG